jgi:hypothetical protein
MSISWDCDQSDSNTHQLYTSNVHWYHCYWLKTPNGNTIIIFSLWFYMSTADFSMFLVSDLRTTVFSKSYLYCTVDIRYRFFSIKSAFLIAFRSRNRLLSHKWTCPSKGVTKILQKGTIWGTVCFILLFDGTLQYLNRTNRSGLSFWLQWKLHFLKRQWC